MNKPTVTKRPLPCAKGKPLRWAVVDEKHGHLLAVFIFGQAARNWAAGVRGKVLEIK